MAYRKTREQELAHYKTNNCEHTFDENGLCFECGEPGIKFKPLTKDNVDAEIIYKYDCDHCGTCIESEDIEMLASQLYEYETSGMIGICCSSCRNDNEIWEGHL